MTSGRITWGRNRFVEVTPWGPGVFRTRIGHGKPSKNWPSYAINGTSSATAPTALARKGNRITAKADGWSLSVTSTGKTSQLNIRFASPNGDVAFATADRDANVAYDKKQGLSLRFKLPHCVQYYGLGEFGERLGRIQGI
ncbi:MAG: hypothetical protein WCK47_00625 [bacterium]|nr:hypothetical protein [Candidatus Sumerlaeota bacterium]